MFDRYIIRGTFPLSLYFETFRNDSFGANVLIVSVSKKVVLGADIMFWDNGQYFTAAFFPIAFLQFPDFFGAFCECLFAAFAFVFLGDLFVIGTCRCRKKQFDLGADIVFKDNGQYSAPLPFQCQIHVLFLIIFDQIFRKFHHF